ncbi:hypothetical protein MID00_19965 [Alcaligenes sp. NLF5-7]|uniref:hypothetical protein n=1 Tax=Alcaligenes sp. NLF5-7 TaxID=2918755 RepID=UPI0020C252C9|nr:hypothetical protein [Alcaligenes sp. NLF5-7]UTM01730.1 hypothetical protein MID00_19965 [Alcaligenes sp. NLF5-7]
MSTDLIGYFSCDPETGAPVWDEGCVCGDNIFSVEGTGTIGRPIKFADTPVSAEPTDDEIIGIAVEPLGIDCDRMPYGVVVFARALLSRYSSAPVATQPDVTQQTLDDVMAGIPARDAEIEALRKEIEALQSQHAATLASIEAFVACDASAISYLSLGEYRKALLKMLRQAPVGKDARA